MEAGPLLELMTREAEGRRDALLAEARVEADRIECEAQAQAQAERDQTLAALEGELSELERRARERAEAAARNAEVSTKDVITEEVLVSVARELSRLAEAPEFISVLERLLAELVSEAAAGAVVLAPPAYAEQVRAALVRLGAPPMEVRPHPALSDGVALQDAAQTSRTTNALHARFEKRKNEARKLCLRQLFGVKV